MLRSLTLSLLILTLAGPAAAETRYLAYDAADRITQALTRGVTLEVERGLFGAISVRRVISTSRRGSAGIHRGGPDAVRQALPDDATEANVYSIAAEGDGRGLARTLCPGADQTWLVTGRVRLVRPLTVQAVGRWPDGTLRHCVQLSYVWRGEWAAPPPQSTVDEAAPPAGPR